MRRGCRIQFGKDFGQDAGHAEEGQCTGEFSVLSRQGGQKPFLGDVFVIGIDWILAMHIFFPKQLRKAKVGCRETAIC